MTSQYFFKQLSKFLGVVKLLSLYIWPLHEFSLMKLNKQVTVHNPDVCKICTRKEGEHGKRSHVKYTS